MAGDKDIQAQDQTHQIQGCRAVVDDNMGYGYCARRYEIGVKRKRTVKGPFSIAIYHQPLQIYGMTSSSHQNCRVLPYSRQWRSSITIWSLFYFTTNKHTIIFVILVVIHRLHLA